MNFECKEVPNENKHLIGFARYLTKSLLEISYEKLKRNNLYSNHYIGI